MPNHTRLRRVALRLGQSRKFVKIVWFNEAVRHLKQASHKFGSGDNRICGAFDLADIRLRATQQGRNFALGQPLHLAPCSQFHANYPITYLGYWHSLYFSTGHKQVGGAKNKWMAYPLLMHPRNRLRELRKKAKLSQSQLAERTGVSQSAISQIENDVIGMDIAWMRSFARELKCETADLLADEDNPDRLNDEERELIESFRKATAEQRTILRRVAKPIAETDAGNEDQRKRA